MIGKIKSMFFIISSYFLMSFSKVALAAPLNPTFLDKPIKDIVLDLIKFLLSITGGLALLFLMFSGVYYMMSSVSTEGRKTAKRMLMSALAGLFLVLISYSILAVLDDLFV